MNKQKHLEFIGNTINRLAGNSFLLKGWTITLIAGAFALAAKDANPCYVLLAFFPAFLFWFLDGFYLQQERLYRCLWNDVSRKDEAEVDFSMNAQGYKKDNPRNTWMYATFASKTVATPYIALIFILLGIMYFTIN